MGATAAISQKSELRIQAETWTRESHGLYDFDG